MQDGVGAGVGSVQLESGTEKGRELDWAHRELIVKAEKMQ